MAIARPDFVPDPSLSRSEMEALQREIAEAAVFEDDLSFDPATLSQQIDSEQQRLPEEAVAGGGTGDPPLVAGVDQAFVDEKAVSAVVAMRNGRVVETVTAVEPASIPYIPGLLSFREGGAILSALAELSVDPDLLLVDGSGRIHFREAGIATHIGVTVDVPAVGVAKSLLCGTPRASLDAKHPVGTRIAIDADEQVTTAPPGTCIGYAVQTRQYESADRHINPLIVSPGHRVSAETAVDLVLATTAGYKLPEPTRLADRAADEAKQDVT